MTPCLGDSQVANDDLTGPQPKSNQLDGIVEVENPEVIGQLVNTECAVGAGQLWELQHRNVPVRQVAECLSARGLCLPGQVPDMVIGVVYPATTLRSMLVERMAGIAGVSVWQVGQNAVDQHSGGPAPSFGVERFQNV